jgi:hypothetical protein
VKLAGVHATQTDEATAARFDSKDEIGISGGERFRSDDPEDARSMLEEPENPRKLRSRSLSSTT